MINSSALSYVLAVSSLVLAIATGCGSPEATPEHGGEAPHPVPGAMVEVRGSRAEAISQFGTVVWLTLPRDTVLVGPLNVSVGLREPREQPPTLDLVSPTMPMHGVVRYGSERVEDGAFTASVHVPMEGRWAVYVNLDDGSDAAWFEFEARAEAGADHMSTHDH